MMRAQRLFKKCANSSLYGHWFQCFVDSTLISSGRLTTQLGQLANSAIDPLLPFKVLVKRSQKRFGDS